MAHPVRKHTRHRRGKRRSHYKLILRQTTTCSQCAKSLLPHRVCPHCGYYRGRQVIVIREKQPKDRAAVAR